MERFHCEKTAITTTTILLTQTPTVVLFQKASEEHTHKHTHTLRHACSVSLEETSV